MTDNNDSSFLFDDEDENQAQAPEQQEPQAPVQQPVSQRQQDQARLQQQQVEQQRQQPPQQQVDPRLLDFVQDPDAWAARHFEQRMAENAIQRAKEVYPDMLDFEPLIRDRAGRIAQEAAQKGQMMSHDQVISKAVQDVRAKVRGYDATAVNQNVNRMALNMDVYHGYNGQQAPKSQFSKPVAEMTLDEVSADAAKRMRASYQ